MGELNLNIGSGSNRKAGYLSIDLYNDAADVMIDITRKLPWEDDSVDNIYACHVIEHLSRAEWEFCRKDWARVLKPGGEIEIYCPDIAFVCIKYLANPKDPYTMMQLYGLQSNDGEYHKNGFTKESLTASFPTLTAELLKPTDDTELHMRFTK